MFLIAVGFWNFLGAGVFGFLINLPIVSYYEIGTAVHRQPRPRGDDGRLRHAGDRLLHVRRPLLHPAGPQAERAMRLSFWSLNIGLRWMLFVNLVPMGGIQLYDAVQNGYWHARQPEFFQQPAVRIIEWLRLPGDLLFIVGGILPVVYLAIRMFRRAAPLRDLPAETTTEEFTQWYEEA